MTAQQQKDNGPNTEATMADKAITFFVDKFDAAKSFVGEQINNATASLNNLPELARQELSKIRSKINSFFQKGLNNLVVEDFANFSNDPEEFKKMLQAYGQSQAVQYQIKRVDSLVAQGTLAPDLGEAFKSKITGTTKIADRRQHNSLVPLQAATEAIDLIEKKWQEFSSSNPSPEELAEKKLEISLRIRLSFDRGGIAAIQNATFDSQIPNLSNTIFKVAALDMSVDDLWKAYNNQIMYMNDTAPENILNYLGRHKLSKENEQAWLERITVEKKLLTKLFQPMMAEERTTRSAVVNSRMTNIGKKGFGALLDLVSSGESGGSYNAMNQGTAGSDEIVNSTLNSEEIIGVKLTDLTIGQILEKQDTGQLFATGRWQITPKTLATATKNSGLSLDEKYSPENQDRLAIAIITYARPDLSDYLTGKSDDLMAAWWDLCHEWAAIPYTDGQSVYPPPNGAAEHITPEMVKNALMSARSSIMSQQGAKT